MDNGIKGMRAHLVAAAGLLGALLVLGISGNCNACPLVLGRLGLMCVVLGVMLLVVLVHMARLGRRAGSGLVFLTRPSPPLGKPEGKVVEGGVKETDGEAAVGAGKVVEEAGVVTETDGEAAVGAGKVVEEAGVVTETDGEVAEADVPEAREPEPRGAAEAGPGSVFLRRTTRKQGAPAGIKVLPR